jgi:putative SOS response-associated peptidase YedK
MCGRYGRRADKQRIAEWMQTHNTNVFDDAYLAPSYNVAPRSFQPVVRLNEDGRANSSSCGGYAHGAKPEYRAQRTV